METPVAKSLSESLAHLGALDHLHVELGKQMVQADGGTMYGMDLLALGALNRSKAHIAGFRQLIHDKNLICAGALLRLQLDTALRFHAAFLVPQPHEFALAVLRGERVRNLKDRDGQKMTDAYLVKKLGAEYFWVPHLYERTSSYIHLSDIHLLSAIGPADGSKESDRIAIKVSAEDKDLPDWIYLETVDAFRAATEVFLRYAHGWVFTKANPELVQKVRNERDSNEDHA